jgi:uncharacterized FlaG/YvyC family protein
MDGINKIGAVNVAAVMPAQTNVEKKNDLTNKISPLLEKKDDPVTPSTQVELSPKAVVQKPTELTSVQFNADPESGKAIVTVISQDDNSVIRQIPSQITVSSMGRSADILPAAPQIIKTTA